MPFKYTGCYVVTLNTFNPLIVILFLRTRIVLGSEKSCTRLITEKNDKCVFQQHVKFHERTDIVPTVTNNRKW